MTASSTATSIFAAASPSDRSRDGTSADAPTFDAPPPTVHANRIGVAAYLSIMNPAPAISMQTEA